MNRRCQLFKVLFNKFVRRALHSNRLGKKAQRGSTQGSKLISHPIIADKYQPALVEGPGRVVKLRKISEDNKAANFNLLLPPPNVTGQLHLGHFLTTAVEDVLVRWRELNGFTCEWIPGTDHAGIATQTVVERKLRHERGVTRQELGRTVFLDEVEAWKTEKQTQIRNDLSGLGLSLNWQKEYFTLDSVRALELLPIRKLLNIYSTYSTSHRQRCTPSSYSSTRA